MNSGVWLLCPYTNLYNALCMLFFDRVEFIEEMYKFFFIFPLQGYPSHAGDIACQRCAKRLHSGEHLHHLITSSPHHRESADNIR